MPRRQPPRRAVTVLCGVLSVACGGLLVPRAASAEDRLTLPTVAFGAAAAADWATTYHGLRHYQLREVNPLLRPLQARPGRLVTAGALMDVGLVGAWNLGIGRRHERVAVAGLWAMAVFRTYLAVHNHRNTRKVPRRTAPVPLPAGPPLPSATACLGPVRAPGCGTAAPFPSLQPGG